MNDDQRTIYNDLDNAIQNLSMLATDGYLDDDVAATVANLNKAWNRVVSVGLRSNLGAGHAATPNTSAMSSPPMNSV